MACYIKLGKLGATREIFDLMAHNLRGLSIESST